MSFLLGIDLGTQGVRAFVVDATGRVVAHASRSFSIETSQIPIGHVEQHPQHWWEATVACLQQITTILGHHMMRLEGVAVAATSGTLCLLDADGHPTYPAIMYHDQRAREEAAWINQIGSTHTKHLGYRFDASFTLPKLLWMQRYQPEVMRATRFFAHAGDVLTGKLTGNYTVSDWSQALKTGYDLINQRWPEFIWDELDLPPERFPTIVAPGTIIGTVTEHAAAETGLPVGLKVVAGMTDGCAAQIAGGAVECGQWMSVLGTTLVIKGVSDQLLLDPLGRIYSHRHPSGMWLPGGASNTGGEMLVRRFPQADLLELDQQAEQLTPTGLLCYPLERRGERFPFVHATAQGFLIGKPKTKRHYYTACLEGVGYVERYAYELVAKLGASFEGGIRVTGGGARSRTWLQIRANILNRSLLVPEQTEGAFGAAVLAGSATLYPDLVSATRAMVHIREQIDPHAHIEEYTTYYKQFVAACQERGYNAD